MYSNWNPINQKEIMVNKKLVEWFGGILTVAVISLFGFVMNIRAYEQTIKANTKGINKNSSDIRKIEVDFNNEIKLLRKEQNKGNLEVIKAIDQLKIELQNKKNRD